MVDEQSLVFSERNAFIRLPLSLPRRRFQLKKGFSVFLLLSVNVVPEEMIKEFGE